MARPARPIAQADNFSRDVTCQLPARPIYTRILLDKNHRRRQLRVSCSFNLAWLPILLLLVMSHGRGLESHQRSSQSGIFEPDSIGQFFIYLLNLKWVTLTVETIGFTSPARIKEVLSKNEKYIADSAPTEYCSTFHCSFVRVSQAWHLTVLTYIKA